MPFQFEAGDYPERPGCYIMKNAEGHILYVGKSKNLRSRLRSYFQNRDQRRRIRQMVLDIASIEVVLVNNESESLLLENNLIKIHKPPYNRALKRDNSGYAYLQMTDERFPRLSEYYRDRRLRAVRGGGGADKAAAPGKELRFGPYRSARFRDAVLDFVTEHYKLRTCDKMPKRVCLLYHLGKCSGVCEGKITEEAYRETARQAAGLLLNQGESLIAAMRAKMNEYAERLEFEKAGSMLRHLRILEEMPEKQIVDREGSIHQDVLYFGEERVLIAKVQEGMLRDFQMHELERAYDEVACDRFLVSRYGEAEGPDELIVNKVSDPGSVRAVLRRTGGRVIKITTPKRGLKYDLLQLCKDNYEYRIGRDGKQS
ncbi:GIY-YIG nuclease family protein [Paenibacillus sp. MZ04-78.2]|uniref:GIY-YIG nuclease family protein n=1 Tax=Paenibacillus sp. MZ04-78.2 TaxID=2962034 RepID=UPI0020B7D0E3|nr:GIY-YIG nuclease family protein [Paenibacillus sp. MZ04-78.2]MCP3774924.1 GIY-YIG nuclease family protein [Paenibacillus sp. MZ04-78.2]